MPNTYPSVTTTQYLEEREKWLREIARGEHVSVMFFPKTDRFRRINQLLEEPAYLKKFFGKDVKYLFHIVDFNINIVEDKYDIQEHIARQLNLSTRVPSTRTFDGWIEHFRNTSTRLVLILLEGERYLTDENKHIFPLLSQVVLAEQSLITTLNVFEADITHPAHREVIYSAKDLFENLFWYPLYNIEDSQAFITYLETKWLMRLKRGMKEDIVKACGGHFWLIKEAVRELLNKSKWSIMEEGMHFRLEAIYSSLLDSEQTALRKVSGKTSDFLPDELHSLSHLRKLGAVGDNNECTVGLFDKFILNHGPKISQFAVVDGVIMLNRIPLKGFFSRKEYRVLKLFLENKDKLITRDNVAAALWPDDTAKHYSDWAIDQMIARLRKRFVELSLAPTMVQSLRGKGYKLIVT